MHGNIERKADTRCVLSFASQHNSHHPIFCIRIRCFYIGNATQEKMFWLDMTMAIAPWKSGEPNLASAFVICPTYPAEDVGSRSG